VEGNGLGVGFVGFRCHDGECELIAIAARQRQGGVGTARGGGEWSRSWVRGVPLLRRECELTAIAARQRQGGVGTALVSALVREVPVGTRRIWLVTTNDNLEAFRFLGAAQLPQVSEAPATKHVIPELERAVKDRGFISGAGFVCARCGPGR
jgi:hypothetical protein